MKLMRFHLADAMRCAVALMLCGAYLSLFGSASFASANGFAAKGVQGDDRVHDPSLIKEGKTYYVFSTGSPNGGIGDGNIQIRASDDLQNWRFIGTVFDKTPAWITETLGSKPKSLWAPDITFFDGKYHLYYSASFFGTNNSLVALATNRTLDPASPSYKWMDEGIVIRTTKNDNWNAIDPQLSFDKEGAAWLALGSFWSGIKLRRIDHRSGKLSSADTTLYSLAERPTPNGGGAIEAPAIIYHRGFYYLFVSFDFCCRGIKSTYKIVVGRARQITGDYVDRHGHSMRDGGGEIIVADDKRYTGSGGQTIYRDGDNIILLVHHFYDPTDNGKSKLHIDRLTWTNDGWTSTPLSNHDQK